VITAARAESNFGTSTPYSLGIEEEYQILDGDTLELIPGIEELLSAFDGDAVRPRIKPELLQSVVEVSTKIGATVSEAVDDLAYLRDRVRGVAAEQGAVIAASGTHPSSRYELQDVTERPRYKELAEDLGWPAELQLVFGLHIHVGVNSAEKAVACANGLRRFLPELLALSANSPFWQGRDTGLASARVLICDSLPRTGLPPVFRSFDEFSELVRRGVESGCFPDYTYIWWDVRPHPKLGTIEVRICDAQTHVENVAALAALVQSIVAVLGSAYDCGQRPAADPDLLLEENKRRAAREGLRAHLIDVGHDTEQPAVEAIRMLADRCEPAAEALGCADELAGLERILAFGTGADEQHGVYEDAADLFAVTKWLAEETVAEPALAR
jgi:carboxylate-amine ligase